MCVKDVSVPCCSLIKLLVRVGGDLMTVCASSSRLGLADISLKSESCWMLLLTCPGVSVCAEDRCTTTCVGYSRLGMSRFG